MSFPDKHWRYKRRDRLVALGAMFVFGAMAGSHLPRLGLSSRLLLFALAADNKKDEANRFMEERIKKAQVLGPVSQLMGGTLAENAIASLELGEWDDAEDSINKAVHVRKSLGGGEWFYYSAKSMLGEATMGRGTDILDSEPVRAKGLLENAESLLVEGYEGIIKSKDLPKNPKDRIIDALERLVKLYVVWNKPDEADLWRQKIAEYTN